MLVTLVGPNLFSKQRELHKLVGTSAVRKIYGENGLAPWFEWVGQSDLFGETATVVGFRIFEDLAVNEQTILATHFESQNVVDSEQLVVAVVEADKQLTGELGKVLRSGKVLSFPQPTPANVGLWLQKEAELRHVQIEKPAVGAMVSRFNADQFALQSELERWALTSKAAITRNDVEQMVPLTTDISNFDLTNSWAQKNTARALDQLFTLRRQGVPDQVIIGSLAWKIESLITSGAKGKWGKAELDEAMVSLFELDFNTKKGLVEPAIGLEMWVVETTSS